MASEGPAHAFHSAAYYQTPDAPQMPLKGWQGADLIFDIDADHLNSPCQEHHDSWECKECGQTGRGERPEICPACKKSRLQEQKWMCDQCLGAAKAEVFKIIEEFLVPDFGISHSNIMIVFSGHRGYHLHCYDEAVRPLSSIARREIVDYISGTGIDFKFHGFFDAGSGLPKGPAAQVPGWEGKIAQGLRKLFQTPDDLEKIPLLRSKQKTLMKKDAKKILAQLMESPPRYVTPKGVGQNAWRILAQTVVDEIRAAIDEPVSTDIHRLIRLPGSLNGKTGFLVKRLDMSSLENFDPFADAQVFEGSAKIFVRKSPAFRLGDIEYPPMNEEEKEFPLSVAIFLMCKETAKLVK